MQVQRKLVVLIALVVSLVASAPASAGIWTPISSGTTNTITAVDYQGAGKLWYTTTNGEIFKNGVRVGNVPGVVLNDIEMSPDGTKGIAVGDSNKAYFSTNSGDTWAATAAALQTRANASCSGASGLVTLTDPLVAVSWVDNATAYAVATPATNDSSPILKTANGGANWTEVNRQVGGACRISQTLTDVKTVHNTTSVFFIGRDFGDIYFSSDGLASNASHRAETVNCYGKRPHLAVDQDNPNRLFATDQCTDVLSMQFSEDNGNAFTYPKLQPEGARVDGLWDVAIAGGTILAVGNGGDVFNSLDGRTAYSQPADGAIATKDWRTVDMASANDAVIAGATGAMATTSQASTIPDLIAPAGTVSGPTTVTAGTPVTYTANVSDNAGGSGIDGSSFVWGATGLPNATGNPVTLTFPSPGYYNVTVNFKDVAGNSAQASLSVYANAASTTPTPTPTPTKTTKTTTASVPGASIKFGVPSGCVAPGSTFKVTLTWSKQKRKGNRFVKVRRADFYIGSKRVKIDKKAPFTQTLTVTASAKPGSTISLRARAYIKVKHGKSPTKSIRSSIKVCG